MNKKLSLVCLALFISVSGVVGCNSSGDSSNVEANTAPTPATPPSITAAPASPISIVVAPANPVAYLPLSSLHQAYAQEFGLNADYVDLVWKAYLPGVKMPQTEKWDLPKINGFLQFVRVTGDNEFKSKNASAGAFNHHAQLALHAPYFDAADLKNAKDAIVQQGGNLLLMKHRILDVAKIYGIPIKDVPPVNVTEDTPFKTLAIAFAGEVSGKVKDVLGDDQGIQGSLVNLLEWSSFELKDSGQMITLVDFPLQDSVSDDVGYLIYQRVYGAFDTSTLHFLDHQ